MFIPDIIRKCVLFLGARDNDKFVPKATCFVVAIEEQNATFQYLVTAEHVISRFRERGWKVWIRSNLVSNETLEEELVDNWIFHPSRDTSPTDVAVTPINFNAQEEYAIVPVTGSNSISGTTEVLTSVGVGTGDEVVVTGLVRSHYGKHKNVPIVRIGNIAMMKGDPVHTYYCGPTDAYLIEARSISGLSGSPVFAIKPYITQFGAPKIGARIYLLGLMHGHFDVENMHEDMVIEDAASANGINTGIGVVIPVEKIIETIHHQTLVEMRRKWLEEHPPAQTPV
jgi:hypothetical protein